MACWVATDTPAAPNGAALAMTTHGTEAEAWARVTSRHALWDRQGLMPLMTPQGTEYVSPGNGHTASLLVSRCSIH